MKHLIPLLLLAGCSYFERSVPEQSATATVPRADLQAKYDSMVAEIVAASDPVSGWPLKDDCDRTLWAGAAGVPGVNIDLAQLAPGVIGRRPDRACWDPELGDQGSKSTTSQDMATGYLLCAWRTKRLDLLETFATACESRSVGIDGQRACIIGEPWPAEASRVLLRSNLLGILGRTIYSISGGADKRDYRALTPFYLGLPEADYERHLQALGMIFDGEVDTQTPKLTDITPQQKDQLAALAVADATDWTAAAGIAVYSGDFAPVLALLMADPIVCPTYTRGDEIDCKVSWAFAARLVLDHLKE
jgi:hypothetical protein